MADFCLKLAVKNLTLVFEQTYVFRSHDTKTRYFPSMLFKGPSAIPTPHHMVSVGDNVICF